MANCANITLERVRSEVSFGALVFETPQIKSFTVSRSRSSMAATFTASIEMPSELPTFPINEEIVIRAGTFGNERLLFTGRVLGITVNPSWERADTYIVSLNGADRFQELEGKTFSRRQRTRGQSTFAAITGVSRKAPLRGLSTEVRKQSGGTQRIMNQDANVREHSKLVRTDRVSWDPFRSAKDPEKRELDDRAQEIIEIKPKTVALSPGVSVLFSLDNESWETGDSWSVSDPALGRIVDNQDDTATYTHLAIGENTITFAKAGAAETTYIGKATAVGIPVHDHSSLGAGGPAFGVYSSD
jgi:hypothetical protein